MTSRPTKGRNLLRVAVAGAVAIAAPFALAGTANAAPESDWDALANCESGSNWNVNTGNGYSGGLQFSAQTWRAFGGTGSAHQASKSQQIAVGERILAGQGWNAWPSCSRKTGVRGNAAGLSVRASAPAASASKAAAPKKGAAAPKAAAPKKAGAPQATPKRTVVAAPAVVAPAASGSLTKDGATYTVVAGDTLSKIAAVHNTAGGWRAVWDRNTDVLSNPNMIRVGQQLDLG